MTEIRFYHLQTQSQAQALPLLLTKAVERGMRVVVKMSSDTDAEQMNETLWTYAADSFLPHGTKKDGKPELQPVWLTASDENPNNASVLFLCQGVESAMQKDFSLCCEMLDGRNPHEIETARARWKSYKELGFAITYWQQTDRGGWEQKA